MKLWQERVKGSAQVLIDWLLSEISPGGLPMNWVNEIALAELSSLAESRQPLPVGLILKTLARLSEQKKSSVVDFEREYAQLRQEVRGRDKRSSWTFLFPLEINLEGKVTFSSLGIKFKLCPFSMTAPINFRDATLSTLEREFRGTSTSSPGAALMASARSSSWHQAWQEIEPAFDALRGAIEFSLGTGSWRFSTAHKPRRKISHPRIMFVQGEDGAIDSARFASRDQGHTFAFQLAEADIRRVKRLSPVFSRAPEPGSIYSLIVNCLRLYAQAMDAEEPYACFLGLWQMAEAICLSESFGGDTDKVVARLAWHGEKLGLKGSGYLYTLKLFAGKRNDIVHRGIHRIEDGDINILKIACEIALWWLVRERRRISDVLHLAQFYRYREMNDAELRAVKRSVAYIEGLRGT